MQDGAAFALMAQPAALAIAPGTAAIYEVEDMRTVFLVEFLHLGKTGFYHLVVPRHVLVGTCSGITDQRVVEVLLAAFQALALAGAINI